MTDADFAALFDGDFTFRIGSGSYKGAREDWEYIDIPEILCCTEVARIVRERKGRGSAQEFTMNRDGARVFWYFKVDDKGGGGVGYPVYSREEAKNHLDRHLSRTDIAYFEVSRHEGNLETKRLRHRFE